MLPGGGHTVNICYMNACRLQLLSTIVGSWQTEDTGYFLAVFSVTLSHSTSPTTR